MIDENPKYWEILGYRQYSTKSYTKFSKCAKLVAKTVKELEQQGKSIDSVNFDDYVEGTTQYWYAVIVTVP